MFKKRFLTGLISCLFSATLLFSCVAKDNQATDRLPTQAQPKSMEEAISTIEAAISKSDVEEKALVGLQKKMNSKPANSFTEEEIKLFINKLLNEFGPDMPRDARDSLRGVLGFISKQLSSYKVSGIAFAFDPNIALIGDTKNPSFTVMFKNNEGKVKSRVYDARITSWGLKIAFSLNFNLIFITGDIDFENSNKVLELGKGIDLALNPFQLILPNPNAERNSMIIELMIDSFFASFFRNPEARSLSQILEDPRLPAKKNDMLRTPFVQLLTLYAPFTNAPGGMLMIGASLGINDGISMVTSGTLTPRTS